LNTMGSNEPYLVYLNFQRMSFKFQVLWYTAALNKGLT
jgi:hypothetical protein